MYEYDQNPDEATIRRFARMQALSFSVLGTIAFFTGHTITISVVVWIIAFMLMLLSWTAPRLIGPWYHAWSFVGWLLGMIVSYLVLALVFLLLVVPIGLGRRLMSSNESDEGSTYWKPHRSSKELSDYFRQY